MTRLPRNDHDDGLHAEEYAFEVRVGAAPHSVGTVVIAVGNRMLRIFLNNTLYGVITLRLFGEWLQNPADGLAYNCGVIEWTREETGDGPRVFLRIHRFGQWQVPERIVEKLREEVLPHRAPA